MCVLVEDFWEEVVYDKGFEELGVFGYKWIWIVMNIW